MKEKAIQHYTVQQLSKLAGVSIRTLHHYDKIGLLKPSTRTEKKYRLYAEAKLLRLQQILFYKELDFALKDIASILNDSDFDVIQTLENQKEALLSKQNRIGVLLKNIDKTLLNLKTGKMLKVEELYEGFPKGAEYREEAMKKWDKQVETSELHLRKKGKVAFAQLKNDFERCCKKMASMRFEHPQSEAVQTEIAKHYQFIREFWRTANQEDQQAVAYAGLGDLYVSDGRYTTVNGEPNTEFAKFMQQAMQYFAKTQLK